MKSLQELAAIRDRMKQTVNTREAAHDTTRVVVDVYKRQDQSGHPFSGTQPAFGRNLRSGHGAVCPFPRSIKNACPGFPGQAFLCAVRWPLFFQRERTERAVPKRSQT